MLDPQLNAELGLQVLCYLVGGGGSSLCATGLCHLSLSNCFSFEKMPY